VERRYSFKTLLTSALGGGEWLASRPGRTLPPEIGPKIPTGKEAGWVPKSDWTHRLQENSLPLPGNEPRSSGRSASSRTLY
jgi:hypothetical protein